MRRELTLEISKGKDSQMRIISLDCKYGFVFEHPNGIFINKHQMRGNNIIYIFS